jgi:hypothetical protein
MKSASLRLAALAALLTPFAAYATTIVVSEPGMTSLLALGVAAAAIVALRKRRK